MKNYKRDDFLGYRLEDVVTRLLAAKERGELLCTEFNGVMLYSDTVTIDDAYKAITGRTKKENDAMYKKLTEEMKKADLEHEKNIPKLTESWINEGKKVLAEDKWQLWEQIVPIRLKDLYKGMELRCCLDLVKKLNDGTFEEARIMIDKQNHSGMSHGLVCAMVKEFSPKGNEFVDFLNKK